MADQAPERGYQARRGREGNRWWNERPRAEDVASWFRENVSLHDGLSHDDFVGGITLIENSEKHKAIMGYGEDGLPRLEDVVEISFTPYPRVDVRIAYFWKWVGLHEGWVGEIAPVDAKLGENSGLPPGFFKLAIPNQEGRQVNFIGRSMRVTVWDRLHDRFVIEAPSETKVVPVLGRWGVDESAVMKASTGAIGRALGAAGILVIPGSGVATAEDMQEIGSGAGAVSAPAAPAELPAEPTIEELRDRLTTHLQALRGTDQEEAMADWWSQRNFGGIAQLGVGDAKTALRRAEELLERAVTTEGQPVGAGNAPA